MQYTNRKKLNTVYFDKFELSVRFILLFHVVVMLNYCSNIANTCVFEIMTEELDLLICIFENHVIIRFKRHTLVRLVIFLHNLSLVFVCNIFIVLITGIGLIFILTFTYLELMYYLNKLVYFLTSPKINQSIL